MVLLIFILCWMFVSFECFLVNSLLICKCACGWVLQLSVSYVANRNGFGFGSGFRVIYDLFRVSGKIRSDPKSGWIRFGSYFSGFFRVRIGYYQNFRVWIWIFKKPARSDPFPSLHETSYLSASPTDTLNEFWISNLKSKTKWVFV